jgi:hypothetical protein
MILSSGSTTGSNSNSSSSGSSSGESDDTESSSTSRSSELEVGAEIFDNLRQEISKELSHTAYSAKLKDRNQSLPGNLPFYGQGVTVLLGAKTGRKDKHARKNKDSKPNEDKFDRVATAKDPFVTKERMLLVKAHFGVGPSGVVNFKHLDSFRWPPEEALNSGSPSAEVLKKIALDERVLKALLTADRSERTTEGGIPEELEAMVDFEEEEEFEGAQNHPVFAESMESVASINGVLFHLRNQGTAEARKLLGSLQQQLGRLSDKYKPNFATPPRPVGGTAGTPRRSRARAPAPSSPSSPPTAPSRGRTGKGSGGSPPRRRRRSRARSAGPRRALLIGGALGVGVSSEVG